MKPNSALNFARMDAGLAQEEVVGALGVSPITVYRCERGETIPHLYFRRRLSKLLHLSEQELGFSETNEEEAPAQKPISFFADPCIPQPSLPTTCQKSSTYTHNFA